MEQSTLHSPIANGPSDKKASTILTVFFFSSSLSSGRGFFFFYASFSVFHYREKMIRSKLEQREICNHRLSDCNDRLPAARMQQRQVVASAVNTARGTDENLGGSHHAKASRPLNSLSNDGSLLHRVVERQFPRDFLRRSRQARHVALPSYRGRRDHGVADGRRPRHRSAAAHVYSHDFIFFLHVFFSLFKLPKTLRLRAQRFSLSILNSNRTKISEHTLNR